MTKRQRTYVLVGGAVGLVLGLLFYTGGRSTAAALSLAVGQAVVLAVVGYVLARDRRGSS